MGVGDEVTSRSSSATSARSSQASADGPGATAASCRTSGWRRACAGAALPRGSSPPRKPKRPARGCSQTVHFTYDFQAPAFYERTGYELVGRVDDFPSGTNVRWYRKPLNGRANERRSV